MNKLNSTMVAAVVALTTGAACGTSETGVRVGEGSVLGRDTNNPEVICVDGVVHTQCCGPHGGVDVSELRDTRVRWISAFSREQVEAVFSCAWDEKLVSDGIGVWGCSEMENIARIIKACRGGGEVKSVLVCGEGKTSLRWQCVGTEEAE